MSALALRMFIQEEDLLTCYSSSSFSSFSNILSKQNATKVIRDRSFKANIGMGNDLLQVHCTYNLCFIFVVQACDIDEKCVLTFIGGDNVCLCAFWIKCIVVLISCLFLSYFVTSSPQTKNNDKNIPTRMLYIQSAKLCKKTNLDRSVLD